MTIKENDYKRLFWLACIAVGIVWYVVFRIAQPLCQEPFSPAFHGNDFKHIYLGSWLMLQHQDPYDAQTMLSTAAARGLGAINPYVYPPFTGMVMAPLAKMDPPQALVTWFLLNHLFMVGSIVLIFLSLRMTANFENVAMVVWLCALCFPLQRTLTAGQLNCALLFLFSLVYYLEQRNHVLSAGAVGAFAFLYKLIPGVLFPYFLWKGMSGRSKEFCRPLRGLGKKGEPVTPGSASLHPGLYSDAPSGGSEDSKRGLEDSKRGLGDSKRGLEDSKRGLGISKQGLEACKRGRDVGVSLKGWRKHDALISMAIATLFLIGLSIWFAGLKTNLDFLPVLSQMGYGKSTWTELGNHFFRDPSNQSFNSFFHHILLGSDGIVPWFAPGPGAANGLTWAASFAILLLMAWRLWPRAKCCFDSSLAYGLFILLGLLIPSIYWDHYAVIALWPLVAAWQKIEPRLKGLTFALYLLLVIPLSNYLSFPVWLTSLFFITAGLTMAALVIRLLRQGGLACVWAIAAAMLCARFAYDLPPFRQGAGLLLMSAKLWPTLLLFGLLLCLVRTPLPQKQES